MYEVEDLLKTQLSIFCPLVHLSAGGEENSVDVGRN